MPFSWPYFFATQSFMQLMIRFSRSNLNLVMIIYLRRIEEQCQENLNVAYDQLLPLSNDDLYIIQKMANINVDQVEVTNALKDLQTCLAYINQAIVATLYQDFDANLEPSTSSVNNMPPQPVINVNVQEFRNVMTK